MASEPTPAVEAAARQSIILGVRHNKSEKAVVKFRIYTDERLAKLFNAYKNYRNDTDPRTVYLWSAPNGAQLKEKQIPSELGLVDDDILDVVVFTQKEGPAPASPQGNKLVVACFAGGLGLFANVPRLTSILQRLGGELVAPPNDARMTHYITENLRTYRALSALLTGLWVVRPSWLLDSDAGSRFIAEAKHALAERQQPPPYAGKRFVLSNSFKVAMQQHPFLREFVRLLLLAKARLGQNELEADHVVVSESPKGVRNRVVLTWWEVLCLCPALLSYNLSRASAETLLNELQQRGGSDTGPVEASVPPSTSPEPVIVRSPSPSEFKQAPLEGAPHTSATDRSATATAHSPMSAPLLVEHTPETDLLSDRPPPVKVASPTPARRTQSSDLLTSPTVSLEPSAASPSANVLPPRRTVSSDLSRTQLALPSAASHQTPPSLASSHLTSIPAFHATSEHEIQELDFLIENLVTSSAELELHLSMTPTTEPQATIWMIPGLGKTRSWLRQHDVPPAQHTTPKGSSSSTRGRGKRGGKS